MADFALRINASHDKKLNFKGGKSTRIIELKNNKYNMQYADATQLQGLIMESHPDNIDRIIVNGYINIPYYLMEFYNVEIIKKENYYVKLPQELFPLTYGPQQIEVIFKNNISYGQISIYVTEYAFDVHEEFVETPINLYKCIDLDIKDNIKIYLYCGTLQDIIIDFKDIDHTSLRNLRINHCTSQLDIIDTLEEDIMFGNITGGRFLHIPYKCGINTRNTDTSITIQTKQPMKISLIICAYNILLHNTYNSMLKNVYDNCFTF